MNYAKKYICPKCGKELYYWTEVVTKKKYKINPYSGIRSQRSCKTDESTMDNEGLICDSCGWILNVMSLWSNDSGYDPEDIKRLLEGIK